MHNTRVLKIATSSRAQVSDGGLLWAIFGGGGSGSRVFGSGVHGRGMCTAQDSRQEKDPLHYPLSRKAAMPTGRCMRR
jgi:hypothetical protein